MKVKFLPAFVLAFCGLIVGLLTTYNGFLGLKTALAQSKPDAPAAAKTDVSKPAINPLALTDAERKQLEPIQQAAIEANQELIAAADALDAAKADAVLAAAWRWKAALTAFKATLTTRANWIAIAAKAHDCAGCELNLQSGAFVKPEKSDK